MDDKFFLNGRYSAVELDKTGIITGYNKKAFTLLCGNRKGDSFDTLENLNISEFSDSDGGLAYNPADPGIFFFKKNGLKLIDFIINDKNESVIVRFSPADTAFEPFFDFIKASSSLFLELDDALDIVLASESFFKIIKSGKGDVYGSGISTFAGKESLIKISSAVELCRKNVLDCIKIDDIHLSFNNVNRVFDLEVYPVNDFETGFAGVFVHLLDSSFQKKCKQMDRTIRRMSAVANFAGGIAHDYNNALTAVLGNISLAKMDAEKDSELEELLKDAESAGLKIKILTERLGMFSRGMKPLKAKTDIKVLIENLISEVFAGFQVRCNADIQNNMTQPEIDSELIVEAIRHVFENALDAADQTTGEVMIKAAEAEISRESVFRETSLVPGRYIEISVRDNGPGLDQHSVSEIFDPYITTKPGREGLGLALTYTILKRHRGFISAETSDNGGAEFKIYIPLF
ncbi:MAG: hypothetical protein CVV49_10925 [Spirochaetae bacterium HGW-Spirochaetae-5]|nr:MAG: hypothetical protein CVV49_10925 [Spirochaetae bacterium HGW-Spirochaetae-5]